MKKYLITFILFTFSFFSFLYAKDKLSESPNSLNYSYVDWSEFYTDIIEASKKDLYQYAYMRNTVNEYETKNILNSIKANSWNLISHKEMNGRDMTLSYFVVSPNNHITVLIFANTDVTLSKYEIASKSSYRLVSSVAFSDSFSSTSSVSKSSKENSSQKKTEAQKIEDDINKKFLEKIISAFDEQLSFFDEEVPLKLSSFSKNH